jgi:hypothetical protein
MFKKDKDKGKLSSQRNTTAEVSSEPFVVPRVGEIRGYATPTFDEYGQPGHEELSDITLVPGNHYAIYIVPNEIDNVGEYRYNGLKRVKVVGSQIEKSNALYFTCMKNCEDLVSSGDELEIGIKEELHRYKFKPVAKGGNRKRKTIRKRRSRKSRRNRARKTRSNTRK